MYSETIPWGINAVKALDISDSNVSNQKVCIIDSGYDINHPDLPSWNSTISGTSQISSESWMEDGNGHGTHVAGTVAAIGGNNQGVVGVNRNGHIKLHIVKIFDNDGIWTHTSDLIQAVESCVTANSTVVNMSLGGSLFSTAANDAFTRMYNNGVLFVAAAGNNGNQEKSYPASYESVISVAAVQSNNLPYYLSQYNDQVDIAAPGVNVESTYPGGKYASLSGTSMATPHVAGIAALVWSHYPTKTAQEVRNALESTAQDLGAPGRDDVFGHGLVQADLAYDCLGGGICSDSGRTGSWCMDSPVGWYDSDGPNYNCTWYAKGSNCERYGDQFENGGLTANEACCVCGGGLTGNPSDLSPVPPSVSPTLAPSTSSDVSVPPSVSPTMAPSSPMNPSNDQLCGCSSCTTDITAKEISAHGMFSTTVGEAIDWFISRLDLSEDLACEIVCNDFFPEICGQQCSPTLCS